MNVHVAGKSRVCFGDTCVTRMDVSRVRYWGVVGTNKSCGNIACIVWMIWISSLSLSWLSDTYDRILFYVWHGPCDMTRTYVSHTCQTSRPDLVQQCAHRCECDMTHSYVWHDSSTCVTRRRNFLQQRTHRCECSTATFPLTSACQRTRPSQFCLQVQC